MLSHTQSQEAVSLGQVMYSSAVTMCFYHCSRPTVYQELIVTEIFHLVVVIITIKALLVFARDWVTICLRLIAIIVGFARVLCLEGFIIEDQVQLIGFIVREVITKRVFAVTREELVTKEEFTSVALGSLKLHFLFIYFYYFFIFKLSFLSSK